VTALPPQVEVVVDSNEALPQHRGYRFDNDRVLRLDCADYSGWAVIDRLRIERKSLPDFLNCCGARRSDFERGTLWPMESYAHRYLVLEFSLQQLAAGQWTQPQVRPAAAIGSLFGWSLRYGVIPILAGDAAHARAAVLRIVTLCTKHAARDAARATDAADAARAAEEGER
jgi:hypothetical protein